MFNEINLDKIDLNSAPPADEPQRQYYFIERAKRDLAKLSAKAGRPLTFCVTTFGCQMNARDSEKLVGILEQVGYVEELEEERLLYLERENGKRAIPSCNLWENIVSAANIKGV